MHIALVPLAAVVLQSAPVTAACLKPTAQDAANADALVKAIAARHSVAAPAEARPHGPPKVGWRHACSGEVLLRVYNVATWEGMDRVVASAKESRQELAGIGQVTVGFYEKENWIALPGGGGKRGPERLLKTVVIQAEPSTSTHK